MSENNKSVSDRSEVEVRRHLTGRKVVCSYVSFYYYSEFLNVFICWSLFVLVFLSNVTSLLDKKKIYIDCCERDPLA